MVTVRGGAICSWGYTWLNSSLWTRLLVFISLAHVPRAGLRKRLWRGSWTRRASTSTRKLLVIGGSSVSLRLEGAECLNSEFMLHASSFTSVSKRVKTKRFDWVHIALPRDTLSTSSRNRLRSADYPRGRPEVKGDDRVKNINVMVSRASKIARAQALTGGWISLAGPVGSHAWRFVGVQCFLKMATVQTGRLDSCWHSDGPPWRERWATNAAWVLACGGGCEDAAVHLEHQRTRSHWTAPSLLFNERLLRAYKSAELPERKVQL